MEYVFSHREHTKENSTNVTNESTRKPCYLNDGFIFRETEYNDWLNLSSA